MKKILMMAVIAMMVVGVAQANLIPNAGFENGTGDVPDGWTIETGSEKITWSDEAYTGSKSMLLTGTGSKPEAVIVSTDFVPVTAGTEYTFSAWVKSMSGGTVSGTNLRLKWYDAAGVEVDVPYGWSNWQWYGVAAGADWAEVTATTIIAPAGAASVEHAWLYSWKGTSGDGVYIDDVSMVPEPMTLALLGLGGLIIRRKRSGI